jgi:hypothetical protein
MQREMVGIRNRAAAVLGCQIRIYTFHRQLVPFPCEQLCRPQAGESIVVPTLRDLRGRVAPGSAVMDTLHQLLTETEVHPGTSHEVLLMTDGGERDSCRHPEEVRRRIQGMPGNTMVRILGFARTSRHRSAIRLMRMLAAPRVLWSFYSTSHGAPANAPLNVEVLHILHNQERESCPI